MNHRTVYFLIIAFVSLYISSCEKDEKGGTTGIPPGDNIVYALANSYYGGYSDKFGLYTTSDTGGVQTPLIESATVAFLDPRWGADSKIYFISKYQGESRQQIYSVNFDGTQVKRISNDTLATFTNLDVSHVTQKVLYNKHKGSVIEFCSNNLPMNDERVLLADTVSARWSPDGSKIIYSRAVPNSAGQKVMNLFLMNADGTGVIKITNNTLGLFTYADPYISPDGTKIVYTSSRDRQFTSTPQTSYLTDVYTCNIDGSNETRVTNSVPQTDFWYNANWTTDSDRILIFQFGFRIQYSMRVRNIRDNSEKLLASSWTMIHADTR